MEDQGKLRYSVRVKASSPCAIQGGVDQGNFGGEGGAPSYDDWLLGRTVWPHGFVLELTIQCLRGGGKKEGRDTSRDQFPMSVSGEDGESLGVSWRR